MSLAAELKSPARKGVPVPFVLTGLGAVGSLFLNSFSAQAGLVSGAAAHVIVGAVSLVGAAAGAALFGAAGFGAGVVIGKVMGRTAQTAEKYAAALGIIGALTGLVGGGLYGAKKGFALGSQEITARLNAPASDLFPVREEARRDLPFRVVRGAQETVVSLAPRNG